MKDSLLTQLRQSIRAAFHPSYRRARMTPLESLESRMLLSAAAYNGAAAGTSAFTNTLFSDGLGDLTRWTAVSGGSPSLQTSGGNSYMQLNNRLAMADLDQTLTQDFNLSFKMIHNQTSTGQWVALTDASGMHGYSVFWDSSTGGAGFVQIRKINRTSALDAWNQSGTAISGNGTPDHAAVSSSMAEFSLTWNNNNHTLTLFVEDDPMFTVTDASFSSFSRLYVGGNGNGKFDDFNVAVGSVTQTGVLAADRFTDAETSLDPIWTTLSGSATVVSDKATPTAQNDNRLKFTANDTRLSSQNATLLGSDKLMSISYDLRRSGSANTGGLFLVDKNGVGYGFLTELAADSYNRATLRVYTTTDFGATKTQIGFADITGITGTGNHVVTFLWDRSNGQISGAIDGKSVTPIVQNTAYTLVDQTIAYGQYGSTLYMDNILVSAIPDSAINIGTRGAVGNGTTDNQQILATALSDAASGSKMVYIPPGTYAHSGTLNLNGVQLVGTGFQSVLLATNRNSAALTLTGNNAAVKNLRVVTRDSGERLKTDTSVGVLANQAQYFVVAGVQIEMSASCGIMNRKSSFGSVNNNTVIDTFADAIHTTDGSNNLQIFNNHIISPADDQIAIVSYSTQTYVCSYINVFHNLTAGQDWGRGLSVVGGQHIVIDNNQVNGTKGSGILIASEVGEDYNTVGVNDVVIRRNTVNGSGALGNQSAIQLSGRSGYTVTNVRIERNTITNSAYRGLSLATDVSDVVVTDNTITGTAQEGINVYGASNVVIQNNVVSETAKAGLFVDNYCTGTLLIDNNHFKNINSTQNTDTDVITIRGGGSTFFVTITNNTYENPANYWVSRFLENNLPLAQSTISNNAEIPGRPNKNHS